MLSTTEPHTRTLKEDVREGIKSGLWVRIIYLNIFIKHPTCSETDKEPHTRTLKEDVREGSKSGFWIRIIYVNMFMKHPTCAETD